MVKRIHTYIALCLPALVSLVVMSCSSGMASKERYLKDSLMKDSFVKDSILKVKAAEEVKLAESKAQTTNSGFEFEGDTLSAERLKAFGARASQKIKDVYDYFRIVSDPTVDRSFKVQALQMLITLFESPESTIEVTLNEGEKPLKITISELAYKLSSQTTVNLKFEVENIRTGTEIETGKVYKGQLNFVQTIYRTNGLKPTIIQRNKMTTTYFIKRVKKQFGSTEKEVWEVLLGDVKVVSD